MNGPRIDDDERGITVNKAAAGLALVVSTISILGSGILVSNAFRDVQNNVQQLEKRLDEQAAERRDVDARLRALEGNREGAAVEIAGLRRDLMEIKDEQRQTNAELRELLAAINGSIGSRAP